MCAANGPINPGPWTVVRKATGKECYGAMCCTGTEHDAIGTAKFWNEQARGDICEAKLMADIPRNLRAEWA